jgi:hypothetical protein
MTRRRPRNRLECETHKIKAREDTGATFYIQFDRERDGLTLGPVCGVRINYKHAKGSDLDAALLKISDLISREIQTPKKELTP